YKSLKDHDSGYSLWNIKWGKFYFKDIGSDGLYMVYAMDENLGIMTLATPVPEFGTIAMMVLLISVMSIVIVFKSGPIKLVSL
ncbi:MAG: PEFG-CTERM sorting domain-containing protein, partial [Candidatus Nitrosomaritimum yanchengensis]